ncbi:hypothetical protein BDV06DRAFT_207089 [Aspergillus oleicola]
MKLSSSMGNARCLLFLIPNHLLLPPTLLLSTTYARSPWMKRWDEMSYDGWHHRLISGFQ